MYLFTPCPPPAHARELRNSANCLYLRSRLLQMAARFGVQVFNNFAVKAVEHTQVHPGSTTVYLFAFSDRPYPVDVLESA